MKAMTYTGTIFDDFADADCQHNSLFRLVLMNILIELFPDRNHSSRLAVRNKLLVVNFDHFTKVCQEYQIGPKMAKRKGIDLGMSSFHFSGEVWAQFVKEYQAALIVKDRDLVEVLFI